MHHRFFSVCAWSTYTIATALIGKATDLSVPLLSPIKNSDQKASCVSGEQWSEWGGAISLADCTNAIQAMVARVPDTTHPWLFWTGGNNDEPPVPWPWHLPKHTDSGEFDLYLTVRHRNGNFGAAFPFRPILDWSDSI